MIAQAMLMANAANALGIDCRRRPVWRARNQRAARIAYSVRCPSFRTRPWANSIWARVAEGKSAVTIQMNSPEVLSALPRSEESPQMSAIQASGGNQYRAKDVNGRASGTAA